MNCLECNQPIPSDEITVSLADEGNCIYAKAHCPNCDEVFYRYADLALFLKEE